MAVWHDFRARTVGALDKYGSGRKTTWAGQILTLNWCWEVLLMAPLRLKGSLYESNTHSGKIDPRLA